MKKAITVILAIFLILSLAACANETVNSPEPTGSPSEAHTPEPTEESTPTPTATIAVTEDPTATPESSPTPNDDQILKGGRDFWIALENGVTYYCDIDGDGLVDSVLFTYSEYDPGVIITRGADPYNPYDYECGAYWGCAWIIDSDPDDGRLEGPEEHQGRSGDRERATQHALSGGDEIERIRIWGGVKLSGEDPASFVFSSEEGFEIYVGTNVFGDNCLYARVRVSENGVEYLNEEYPFSNPHEYTLKLELPVTILNEDGTEGESYTVPVGETISPVYTDDDYEATFVVVRLGDGRLAKVTIERAEYSYTINGVDQFEYADFPEGV